MSEVTLELTDMPKLAVYGTLRKDHGNYNHFLKNDKCHYLGQQRTEPNFKMVSLGAFPGVIPVEKDGYPVVVDIIAVDSSEVLRRVDGLEGYPHFYGKHVIETKWGPATMYILNEKEYGHLTQVSSGDWEEYINEKRNVSNRH